MSEKECSICFYNYRQDNMWSCSECKQECHQYCIEKWSIENPTCPFCRCEIKDLVTMYSDININININEIDQSSNRVINTQDQSNNRLRINRNNENYINNIIRYISNKLNSDYKESKQEMGTFLFWYIVILAIKISVDLTSVT